MPCDSGYGESGSYYPDDSKRIAAERKLREAEKELADQLKTTDVLARMLCGVCTDLAERGEDIPPHVKDWWVQHQKQDEAEAEKEAQEELARLVASKLREDRIREHERLKSLAKQLQKQLSTDELSALEQFGFEQQP